MPEDTSWLDSIVTPRVGAVALVESPDRAKVLLIRRRFPPPGLAFPGGFMQVGETVEQAAAREVLEETGVVAEGVGLLTVTSEPCLDPRAHFVVVACVFRATGQGDTVAADDASEAFWVDWQELESKSANWRQLTERSKAEFAEYLRWRRWGHDWRGLQWPLTKLG